MQETKGGEFAAMIEPHRGELRVHCYRMLGSSSDGDDVVQDTLLRAWRARDSLKDPALVRPWLYRIATNACLDELKRRPKRVVTSDAFPAADPEMPLAPPMEAGTWIEPMPDDWTAGMSADPGARYALKESVALAFVAALHILSPAQRAVLLLRDVVGLSAEETAEALGMNVGAANSALFRARAAVEEKLGAKSGGEIAPPDAIDEALLARYVRAFEEANIASLVAILHEDVKTRMPPFATWLDGRAATIRFLSRNFAQASHAAGNFRIVRCRANGQPAFAFYRGDPGMPRTFRAISVLDVRDGAITAVDHFMTPEVATRFGLAAELPR